MRCNSGAKVQVQVGVVVVVVSRWVVFARSLTVRQPIPHAFETRLAEESTNRHQHAFPHIDTHSRAAPHEERITAAEQILMGALSTALYGGCKRNHYQSLRVGKRQVIIFF